MSAAMSLPEPKRPLVVAWGWMFSVYYATEQHAAELRARGVLTRAYLDPIAKMHSLEVPRGAYRELRAVIGAHATSDYTNFPFVSPTPDVELEPYENLFAHQLMARRSGIMKGGTVALPWSLARFGFTSVVAFANDDVVSRMLTFAMSQNLDVGLVDVGHEPRLSNVTLCTYRGALQHIDAITDLDQDWGCSLIFDAENAPQLRAVYNQLNERFRLGITQLDVVPHAATMLLGPMRRSAS